MQSAVEQIEYRSDGETVEVKQVKPSRYVQSMKTARRRDESKQNKNNCAECV